MATKFRYSVVAGIPSPPLEERARARRPHAAKFLCHDTSRANGSLVLGGRAFILALALLLCIFFAGCSNDPAQDASVSDANGYICQKCNLKFYTRGSAFAEVCPNCKITDIRPVVGYVCNKDGFTTIIPKSRGAVVCQKCQAPVSAIKLPREADLKTWGAIKKDKAEVSQK